MILKVRRRSDVPYSEVTPEHIYLSRRTFLQALGVGGAGVAAGLAFGSREVDAQAPLAATRNAKYIATDKPNTFEEITTYNNFYEFGTRYEDASTYAGRLTVKPWTVKVEGLVKKTGSYNVDDLVDFKALEERVYRHRCVEAWSMVMPFIGVPLSSVLAKLEPQPSAEVRRVHDAPASVRDAGTAHVRSAVAVRRGAAHGRSDAPAHAHGRWPLRQGASQSEWGAAARAYPMEVRLQEWQVHRAESGLPTSSPETPGRLRPRASTGSTPTSTHRAASALESGAREPPASLFKTTQTQMFNGYAEEVASLYTGMDLARNF
jgi:sulfoxide reductase catalytic subunit YedY